MDGMALEQVLLGGSSVSPANHQSAIASYAFITAF
jgi:hypothetical protein